MKDKGVSPSGPGSREPSQQAVSAADAASIPDAVIEAVEFYAFAENWHGVYMCGHGPMTDDWSDDYDDPQYPDGKPGKLARAAVRWLHEHGYYDELTERVTADAQADGSPQGGNDEVGSIAEGDDSPVREADAPPGEEAERLVYNLLAGCVNNPTALAQEIAAAIRALKSTAPTVSPLGPEIRCPNCRVKFQYVNDVDAHLAALTPTGEI